MYSFAKGDHIDEWLGQYWNDPWPGRVGRGGLASTWPSELEESAVAWHSSQSLHSELIPGRTSPSCVLPGSLLLTWSGNSLGMIGGNRGLLIKAKHGIITESWEMEREGETSWWSTGASRGQVLCGRKRRWKCHRLPWWQPQQCCTPIPKPITTNPTEKQLHCKPFSWMACLSHSTTPEGSVLLQENIQLHNSLPNNFSPSSLCYHCYYF